MSLSWYARFLLVQPYSETSSATDTDTEEAPALPPRDWKTGTRDNGSISPIGLATGPEFDLVQAERLLGHVPSITVSPPRANISPLSKPHYDACFVHYLLDIFYGSSIQITELCLKPRGVILRCRGFLCPALYRPI